jgi:hypothetical protein
VIGGTPDFKARAGLYPAYVIAPKLAGFRDMSQHFGQSPALFVCRAAVKNILAGLI